MICAETLDQIIFEIFRFIRSIPRFSQHTVSLTLETYSQVRSTSSLKYVIIETKLPEWHVMFLSFWTWDIIFGNNQQMSKGSGQAKMKRESEKGKKCERWAGIIIGKRWNRERERWKREKATVGKIKRSQEWKENLGRDEEREEKWYEGERSTNFIGTWLT